MKLIQIPAVLALTVSALLLQAASVTHDWDIDKLSGGAPVDVVGSVPTSNNNSAGIFNFRTDHTSTQVLSNAILTTVNQPNPGSVSSSSYLPCCRCIDTAPPSLGARPEL